MAFCTDREDVVSLSLTAVHHLLEKYGVDPANIGRFASDVERVTLCKWSWQRLGACNVIIPPAYSCHASNPSAAQGCLCT